MKKFLTAMVAGATLFSAGAAFAANQVQVTLTSPTILKVGCEKAGAVTFAFDNQTRIKSGDWWYMDLPVGVTLCKSYDYMIGATTSTAGTGAAYDSLTGLMTFAAGAGIPSPITETFTGPLTATVVGTTAPITSPNAAFVFNDSDNTGAGGEDAAAWAAITGALGAGIANPLSAANIAIVADLLACGGNADATTTAAEIAAFIAAYDRDGNGSVYANEFDTVAVPGISDAMTFKVVGTAGSRRITVYALGATPYTTMVVQDGYKLNFKIMDGKSFNKSGAVTSTMILTNKDTETTATNYIYGEKDYSGSLDEVIGGDETTAAIEPAVENTLCIDASIYGGELVFVSFASKSDKFTFTGDSQIAHIGASVALSLVNCKGATSGQILIGGQNACTFNYQTAAGYCPTFGGNRVAIQSNAATFGDLADKYALTAESMTDGVYFNNAALTLKGYTQAQSANGAWCSATGTAIAATFTGYVGSSVATAFPDSSCSVVASKKVAKIATAAGAFIMNDMNTLETTLPPMVYDKTVIASGIEAKVKLTLDKYPCGTIFVGTQTVGTFVTTCTAAAGTTSLMFPFFPPMDPSAAPGWWGGYVIVNGGSSSGTAVLTYTDAAGATATYTTAAIAAGAQFNGSGLTSGDLTAGTGTFSTTSNYSIKAACNFSMAAGFAFVSSPEAAASYVAYTSSGWQ